ncbi:MAG: amidohydrolase [Acidobacteriota bacterium]
MRRGYLLLLVTLLLSVLFTVSAQEERRQYSVRALSSSSEREIAQAAEALRSHLIAQRRDFHMHPELSNREERTSRVVAEQLRALRLDEVKTGVGKYGVVAILKGAKPGPVVAVRADMDALPIDETIDVSYKSSVPGVKHACGHDVHTAVQLGVAEVLSKMRDRIPGTIKFIFQPAEEGAPAGEEGGADLMIKEGALESPHPEAIFALHVTANLEVGQAVYHAGPTMAAADLFYITIRGKKVHGAYPHEGVDAIAVAAECVTALQHIRSRRINTMDPLVISIGIIQGGNRANILADEVKLEGTVRTLSEEVRERVEHLMRETLSGITSAYGASFEMKYERGAPVTYNDPKLVEETLPIMRRILGPANVINLSPQMGAEDFSYYQKVIPGFYYFLGGGNHAKGINAITHTAEFDVDEDSLVVGVKLMSSILLDYLERQPRAAHHPNH